MNTHLHRPPFVLFLVASLWLGGCIPEFKNPPPKPQKGSIDPRLLGTWVLDCQDADEADEKVAVFPTKSGYIDVVYVVRQRSDKGKESPPETTVFRGYSVRIDNADYLCLLCQAPVRDDGEPAGHIMARYDASVKGKVAIWWFDRHKVNALIESGVLEGTLGAPLYPSAVTSPADRLLSLLKTKGCEAFADKNARVVFRRTTLGGAAGTVSSTRPPSARSQRTELEQGMVVRVTDLATNREIEISKEALKASIRKHGAPNGERLLADLTGRVHLEWLQQFPPDDRYWLLILHTQPNFVPTYCSVTLIVTDSGLRVRSWVTTRGSPMGKICGHFRSGQVKHELKLFCDDPLGGARVDTFAVTPDSIVKVSSCIDETLSFSIFP